MKTNYYPKGGRCAACAKQHADHTHPWHDLRNLLRGLPEQPSQSEGGQDE